jgi:hypothetical protein
MLETRAKYLYEDFRPFSNTYGVNEKGGMNKEEFGKWASTNFIKLVAGDVADLPGKRVLLLVDGGPGRTNEEMLNKRRHLGIYLFPSGPPNTTHVLQIMDMLFGKFKTIYFNNLEILWQWRQNTLGQAKTITRNDIALLCYGSAMRRETNPTFPLLANAVEEAFAIDLIKDKWLNKLGIFPKFTRAALKSKAIRHEVVV